MQNASTIGGYAEVTGKRPDSKLNRSLSSRQVKKQKFFYQDLRNEVLVFFMLPPANCGRLPVADNSACADAAHGYSSG